MGTCCFTPRKTHFLWWYWLLLASVVGIPMFLAARHVQRHPAESEEEQKKVSKEARKIFWSTAYGFLLLSCIGSYLIMSDLNVLRSSYWGGFGHMYTLTALLVDFFAYFLAASYAARHCRKASNPLDRIVYIIGVLLIITFISAVSMVFCLVIFSDFIQFPVVGLMLFLICMLPAHYWQDFQAQPTRTTSWRALAAILIAAPLFYGAARYGIVGHYYVHELVHGRAPDPGKAVWYLGVEGKQKVSYWEDRK